MLVNTRWVGILGLSVVPFAHADMLGATVGMGAWHPQVDTQLGATGFGQTWQQTHNQPTSWWLAFEHPVPVMPNVQLARQQFSTKQQGVLEHAWSVGGQDFNANTNLVVQTETKLTDLTAYYELVDFELVSVDAGVALRWLQGDLHAQANASQGQLKWSGVLPALYLNSRVELFATDMFLYAKGHYAKYQQHHWWDTQVGLKYQWLDLVAMSGELVLGWQVADIAIIDKHQSDYLQRMDGIFVGLEFDF